MKSWLGVSMRRRLVHALMLAVLVSCAACGRPAGESGQPPAPGLHGVSPKLVLFNQRAQPVEARSLTGRPVLIAFIDTACAGMCQRTTSKLHEVVDELGTEQAQKVQFVLVTYNPVYDGPKRLAGYAEKMQLDTSRWMLLTGTPDNIDWILGRFGLPAVGSVDNPALLMDDLDYLFLIAPDGRIKKKYRGAAFTITEVAQDTRKVLNKDAS